MWRWKMNDDGNKILVCEECGSSNVQMRAWVNANTLDYTSDSGDTDRDNYWCEDCEEHNYLCSRSDYLNGKKNE